MDFRKLVFIVASLAAFVPTFAQSSHDTIYFRQRNGTAVTLVGIGDAYERYTETIDGYTVVLNQSGIYEIAKRGKDGDLVPSGILALDPGDRSAKDARKMKRIPHHLRYEGKKLEKRLNLRKKFEQEFEELEKKRQEQEKK